MNIGIIGLNVNNMELNYGTILHTWAFKEFLISENYCSSDEIEIINYFPQHSQGRICKYPFKYYLTNRQYSQGLKYVLFRKPYADRYDLFEDFKQRHFKISKPYDLQTLESEALRYDIIIVEADTVWAKLGGRYDPAFFLALKSMQNSKRIAYAPDVGPKKPSDKDISEMTALMKGIDYISGRGQHSTDVIRKCTNLQVANVIDPTLLISLDHYNTICGRRMIDERYVFVYLVGDNRDMYQEAKKYARKHGIRIMVMTSRITKRSFFSHIGRNYALGVEDFISAIRYSECVFTNSFHGICLSIVYKKNFYAYSREGSKIEDLCTMCGLESRIRHKDITPKASKIDYGTVDAKMRIAIDYSENWLRNAIRM